PCALAAHSAPVVTAEQKAIVDLVISSDPDSMTEPQRLRFVSMIAAYAGVQINDVQLLSVSRANSSRLRLEMPSSAAQKLSAGFAGDDPLLAAFLEDFELIQVQAGAGAHGSNARARTTDVSEKALETLIVRHLTGSDGLSVPSGSVAVSRDTNGSGYFAGS